MNCPSCGAKASSKDKFCRRCGASLLEKDAGLEDALARMQLGDFEGAVGLLKGLAAGRAGDPRLLSWLGHALYLSGREAEARARYDEAVATGAAPWDAHYQRATLSFAARDFAASADGYSKALAMAPESLLGHPLSPLFGGSLEKLLASCRLYLGLCLKEQGAHAEAEAELREAVRLDASNPLPYGVLGDLLMASSRFMEAAQAYEGALSSVEDEASLLALRNDLGVAFFRGGKLDAAAEEFKKVIQKDPKNSNAIYNLGVLYLKQGMSEGMREDLKEFLKAEDAEHILLGLTRSMVDAARKQAGEGERAGILGRSRAMADVLELSRRAASSEATVLLLGENGTGKELVARAIHQMGPRHEKPFVAVNCGALPETLLESELFGYEKGAFTGAQAAKPGRFELAEGGTLFLDEIGDLKLSLQVKLLRAIQEKSYERLGGTRTLEADVRIIAATNSDLRERVLRGEFREDLFYRLFVIPITLPPLRERVEDIAVLAQHFLERAASKSGRHFRSLAPDALARLEAHPWPGNVRELENVMERAVAMHDGELLEAGHLQFDPAMSAPAGAGQGKIAAPTLEDAEKQAILLQLKMADFKVANAAKALGLSRATLYRKMQKFNISMPSELSH